MLSFESLEETLGIEALKVRHGLPSRARSEISAENKPNFEAIASPHGPRGARTEERHSCNGNGHASGGVHVSCACGAHVVIET